MYNRLTTCNSYFLSNVVLHTISSWLYKKNIEVCEILLEMQKKSSLLIENQTNSTVTKSFGIATKRWI